MMLFTRRIVRYDYKGSLRAKGKVRILEIYGGHRVTGENWR